MRKAFATALIDESDLAHCLHIVFQNQGIEPGVFMGLRTRDEPIPDGERAFMLASVKKAMEDGYLPLKVQNFSSNKKKSD